MAWVNHPFISLRYPTYRRVWQASFSEHLGEWIETITLFWLVRQLTPSPFLISLIGLSRFIGLAIFPIPGGIVADRMDRRRLLILTLVGMALISLTLAGLAYSQRIALWHIGVLSLLAGAITGFNHPARMSLVPNLVRREHLLNAMALDSITVVGAIMIAGPIAGYLIGVIGMAPIFLLRVLGAVVAIFWLQGIKVPPTPEAARSRDLWQNLKETWHYLGQQGLVRGLVLLYTLPMFTYYAYLSLLPVFAVDVLKVSSAGYGLLHMAAGSGAVVTLVACAALTGFRHKGWLLLSFGLVLGLGLTGFAFSTLFLFSWLLLALTDGARNGFIAVNGTLIQGLIPDELRGRLMSFRDIFMGLGPWGGLIAGAMAEYTGVALAVGLWGGIALVASLAVTLLAPKIRELS